MAERRRLERFDLTAPALVLVESESGQRTKLNLTTKNISSAGAYLYCLQPPFEAASVRMELQIRLDTVWNQSGEKGRTRIEVWGTIIRRDPDGFAIRFQSNYKIRAHGSDNGVGSF